MSTAVIKPHWSPLNIALMVLGFVFFWPLGLAMLAYILWGEHYGGSSDKAEKWMKNQKCKMKSRRAGRHGRHNATGNAAFDEYREAEMRRLEEERMRLEQERSDFEEFLQSLHMARDREEFDRFKTAHKAKSFDDEDTSEKPKKKKRDLDDE
ncbi:DUF2852 domain-containing protein [Maritalea sp.]|uniref:DUF2852 domain-containing protein n=1 Tax=Maritalea sp. TaxID=2003361 RepID=UPI003EF23292